MSGLCKIFGHKRNKGWWGDGLYGVLRGPATDGIGREHYTVTLDCDRCGERYLAARFHGPLTTPPARTYAEGVEDAAKVAEKMYVQDAFRFEFGHDVAAAIRLLSQGGGKA